MKIDVTLTSQELRSAAPDFDKTDPDKCSALVHAVVGDLGLAAAKGGWIFKVTSPKAGGAKLTGTLIQPGAVVLG